MIYKNRSGQCVAFGLVSVSDGTAVVGASPVVRVTKDAGSQTTGGGTVTELGNGQYRYAFTQAETNAESVMVLATATGAVLTSLTVYPKDTAEAQAANLTQIDGTALASAALNLKQLNIVNSSGNAVVVNGSEHSVFINHAGSAGAVYVANLTPNQNVVELAQLPATAGTGSALRLVNNGNSTGTTVSVGHGSQAAVNIQGGAGGTGVIIQGGPTGTGLAIVGGATSGPGMVVTTTSGTGLNIVSSLGVGMAVASGGTNMAAINAVGSGTGAGIRAQGGSTGPGIRVRGGGTSGHGIDIATTDGHGVEVTAAGTEKFDIHADNWGGMDVPQGLSDVMEKLEEIDDSMQALDDVLTGPGTHPVTLVVREPDGGAAIADAEVWITSVEGAATPVVARGRTDVEGEVQFMLEEGETYYLWAVRVGMNPIMGEAFVAE